MKAQRYARSAGSEGVKIKRFIFGAFETNTYVVSDAESVLLVDPACSNEREQAELLSYMQSPDMVHLPVRIIATHGHLDHLWGAAWACEQFSTHVQMHPADIPMAQAMQQQYMLFGIRQRAVPFKTASLTESIDRIQTGLHIIHTPGHTPGSVGLYWPEENLLLSGDTLFRMGYGRTDLPGGNMGQLIESLERLFTLPAETIVYPGHGEKTTIGDERR
jgi:glyoxylase-like metal-dependent hydrolase (beta-lactamase superfamily II)